MLALIERRICRAAMKNIFTLLLLGSQVIFLCILWHLLANATPPGLKEVTVAVNNQGHNKQSVVKDVTVVTKKPAAKAPISQARQVVIAVDEPVQTYRNACTTVFLLNIPSTHCSTVQNILLRKAIAAGLKIALPQPNKDTLCFPKTFTKTCPTNLNEDPYDMLVHQINYEKEAVADVLKPNAKFVLLARHPILHLQALYYDNEWSDYVRGISFQAFIEDHYHRFAKTYDYEKNLPYRNVQLFMLGMPTRHNDARGIFQYKISQVVKEFDVIMLQEHMLESLVLLKHKLQWNYEELVSFSLQPHPENNDLGELTKLVNDTIVLNNEADMKLYETLIEEFQDRVSLFGKERMRKEAALLQEEINKETQLCLSKSQKEMEAPVRRVEQRLSWDGEGERRCHFYISRDTELTSLLSMRYKDKEDNKQRLLNDKRRAIAELNNKNNIKNNDMDN